MKTVVERFYNRMLKKAADEFPWEVREKLAEPEQELDPLETTLREVGPKGPVLRGGDAKIRVYKEPGLPPRPARPGERMNRIRRERGGEFDTILVPRNRVDEMMEELKQNQSQYYTNKGLGRVRERRKHEEPTDPGLKPIEEEYDIGRPGGPVEEGDEEERLTTKLPVPDPLSRRPRIPGQPLPPVSDPGAAQSGGVPPLREISLGPAAYSPEGMQEREKIMRQIERDEQQKQQRREELERRRRRQDVLSTPVSQIPGQIWKWWRGMPEGEQMQGQEPPEPPTLGEPQ